MSGASIDWLSQKQLVVTLSTIEAEYMALSSATQEAVCMAKQITNRHQSTTQTPTVSKKTTKELLLQQEIQFLITEPCKHIDIKFHYVREALEDKIIDFIYYPTEQMIACRYIKVAVKWKLW